MNKLTVDEVIEIAKTKDELRFNHVFETFKKATYLAQKYHVDLYKVQVASLLHDYAKNETIETMENILKIIDPTYLKYDRIIFHGVVGAYMVEKDLGINDQDILNAIKYHVTGRPEMDDISKIVYIADFTEETRTHEGVLLSRSLSEISLDLGVLSCAERTLEFLKDLKASNIHPNTLNTFQYYLEKVGKNNYEFIRNNCTCV